MGIVPSPSSVETKGVGSSMLHFTGGQKVTQAISITADFLILDEFSFLDPTTRDTFEDRLLASEDAMTLELSIPSGTETGIESIVAASALYLWHVRPLLTAQPFCAIII
jgi:ABC-type taurine transport system ATPase subunit